MTRAPEHDIFSTENLASFFGYFSPPLLLLTLAGAGLDAKDAVDQS